MDWYSWLSNSGLDPSLVYEYSLLFSRNELEECDVAHFNHEFLQSMGIAIAKHRIEILKLAKKEKSMSPRRLLAVIHRTRRFLSRYLSSLIQRDGSAIVVVPRPTYHGGGHWKGSAMLRRSKRPALLLKHNRRMITGGEEVGWDSMFKNLKPT
ncbi:uncharacterized protein [Typha latifolia]|uniref:uncharacterized protein n=1 Tax=Typha latifolia TaxID=4733 RepID=UPI003C2C4C75